MAYESERPEYRKAGARESIFPFNLASTSTMAMFTGVELWFGTMVFHTENMESPGNRIETSPHLA